MSGGKPLFTYEQSRILDAKSMDAGWTSTGLMGQAALSSLYRLMQEYRPDAGIVFFCGPGNNGGDGLALCWHFYSWLGQTEGLFVVQTGPARSQASRFYEGLVKQAGIPIRNAEDFLENFRGNEPHPHGRQPADREPLDPLSRDGKKETEEQTNASAGAPIRIEPGPPGTIPFLVVEALLGSGQDRPLAGAFAGLCGIVREWQELGARVISLDVPAGLLENRPFHETTLFVPDEIHTYGPHRLACSLSPELLQSRIYSNPIGFLPETESPYIYFPRDARRKLLFSRRAGSHKYENGFCWILGGSTGMEGALLLSSRSFFASGGGILCAVSSSGSLYQTEPSIMWKDSLQIDGRTNAVVVGPGTSREDALGYLEMIRSAFSRRMHGSEDPANHASYREEQTSGTYLILDASAAIQLKDFPSLKGHRTLLTPHPGEWKALGGEIIDHVSVLEKALHFCKEEIGCYVLYKSSSSILLDPFQGKAYVFPWSNRNLAVAGTGDCLTGILMAALSRTDSMVEAVAASMELLHASTEQDMNPMSSSFPDAIRRHLSSSYSPGRDGTGGHTKVERGLV